MEANSYLIIVYLFVSSIHSLTRFLVASFPSNKSVTRVQTKVARVDKFGALHLIYILPVVNMLIL